MQEMGAKTLRAHVFKSLPLHRFAVFLLGHSHSVDQKISHLVNKYLLSAHYA
jgi:hypothetical protein